ncbi:MAG: glycoside hydrolase family 9 protein [Kiritimatiellae bacterium]|nr:glycoside hydrolase family 9 protein [Kiritimatiellia bacterium]
MKKYIIALIAMASVGQLCFAEQVAAYSMVDTKPMVMKMYGVRSAGATAPDKIQVVVGCSQTGAVFGKKSYRIISEEDSNYKYESFVEPVEAKKIASEKEFIVPEGYDAPGGGNIKHLMRAVVELKLPHPMVSGKKYTVIAQGEGGTMVTAAHTAHSFVYDPNQTFTYPKAGEDALAAQMVGLRGMRSVGNGIVLLEFGAAYSFPGGNVLTAYDFTYNGKKVDVEAMGRRSRLDIYQPSGWPFKGYVMHDVFVKLPVTLKDGDVLEVTVAESVTSGNRKAKLEYKLKDLSSFSDAIQVNQVGYLPNNLKVAYLGRWLGSYPEIVKKAGDKKVDDEELDISLAAIYPDVPERLIDPPPVVEEPVVEENAEELPLPTNSLAFDNPPEFKICDAKSGKVVYKGTAKFIQRGDQPDFRVSHSGSNVYELDFTEFTKSGSYYIVVDGVGRSLPFDINADVYKTAFDIQSYGVFAQRCGQELSEPYSDWKRIACHVKGVVPTTNPFSVRDMGKFEKTIIYSPVKPKVPEATAAIKNDPALVAYIDFDKPFTDFDNGYLKLTSRGGGQFIKSDDIADAKACYAAESSDKNGFDGTLVWEDDKGLTLSIWIYRDDSVSGGNKYNNNIFAFGEYTRYSFSFFAGWGVLRCDGAGFGRISDRKWHNFTYSIHPKDQQTGKFKAEVYWDGEKVGEAKLTRRDSDKFTLASINDECAAGTYFDDFRVYNKALTAEEAAALAVVIPERLPVVLKTRGGHHDAGDYNPRSHLDVAQVLLMAYELAPQKFYDGQLNIPEKANGIPDIVDEALWAIRIWNGLYNDKDGSVYEGTESDGDPNFIQSVELDPKGDFAWAKTSRAALNYAAVMARTARILKTCKITQQPTYESEEEAALQPKLSADAYLARARKAFEWGVANPPKGLKKSAQYAQQHVTCLAYAAAELYRTTGEKKYHKAFKENVPWGTKTNVSLAVDNTWDLSWAAYAYAFLPDNMADPVYKEQAIASIKKEADMYLVGSGRMAYKFVRHSFAPISWGTGAYQNFCLPIMAMWGLTKDQYYYDWLIRTCDNTLGANPMCLSWVIGIGERTVHAPLHNSRYSPFGKPVKGQQVEGPYMNVGGYNVPDTMYPRPSRSNAIMYQFVDAHFAIAMDEGVVNNQSKTMAVFGLLLPDKK